MNQSYLCIGGPLDGQRVGLEGAPNNFAVPDIDDKSNDLLHPGTDAATFKQITYAHVELTAPIAGTATSRRWTVYTNEDHAEIIGKLIERYTPPPTAETKSFWARTMWQLISRFAIQYRENGQGDKDLARKIQGLLATGSPR